MSLEVISNLRILRFKFLVDLSNPNHFGIASFPALGRQILLVINVVSLHLTPMG